MILNKHADIVPYCTACGAELDCNIEKAGYDGMYYIHVDQCGHCAKSPIVVETDGGPWATHNYPCPVCCDSKAVLMLNTGIFYPCWRCQEVGWVMLKVPRFLRRIINRIARGKP